MKCCRCKKVIEKDGICQNCKNELLLYYEATNDWQMAFDMELAKESVLRFKNQDDDYPEMEF